MKASVRASAGLRPAGRLRAAAGLRPLLLGLVWLCRGQSPLPRTPFSGVYGGTAGAGSIPGWDRTGGDNPAVIGVPGWTVSAAGYAPFGLDDLRVTEAVVARDRARWGISASCRGMFIEGAEPVSRFGMQSVFRIGPARAGRGSPLISGLSSGFAVEYEPASSGSSSLETSSGLLWRPRSWGSLGGFWKQGWGSAEAVDGIGTHAGLGAEGGAQWLPGGGRAPGIAWRLAAERIYARPVHGKPYWENRFAAALRLHALLSLYSGWDPSRETAALGVRFGMGAWEGFSSMRRHAALGGASLQGIRWHQAAIESPTSGKSP